MSVRNPFELVYQIFPDRWRNAVPALTPKPGAWKWREHPIAVSRNVKRLTRFPTDQYTFFGGDLEGIRQSLPYLQRLGVTALYLTPIFEARSTHRYDTVNFLRIDPALGSRADFERLAADLHACGMKLVLDGVFNHTGDDHPLYRDPAKRMRYYIPRDKERTMTWMGGSTLPKLDTQRPAVEKMILRIIDAWPEVDVWRLDAAHLLPHALLAKIRDRAAPRPIIIEDWHVGRQYFEKNLAHGITNFLFLEALRTFFVEDASPETLLARLARWSELYTPETTALSWNFLDNHDTGRFISYTSRERLMRALVLLFTLPGTPLLYHGLEIGMSGKTANAARAPMIWDESQWDGELLEHVRTLVDLRRKHPVLVLGDFRPLFADNRSRTLVFERRMRGARAVVALNDGYHPCNLTVGGLRLRIKPGEWRVLIPHNGLH